jgi:hypothetical protein
VLRREAWWQRAKRGRGDEGLAACRNAFEQRRAAAIVELAKHVVEEEHRRLVAAITEHLRLGEQQREHGDALLSLRSEGTKVSRSRLDREVAKVRPGAGRPAGQIAVESRIQFRDREASHLVAERCVLEPERSRRRGEGPGERGGRLGTGRVELGPARRQGLRPRSERRQGRLASGGVAQRRVALCERLSVLGRDGRAGGQEPAENSIEVCAPDDRTSLDDREAVRREREDGEPAPELVSRGNGCSIERDPLRASRLNRDRRLEATIGGG